MIQIIHFLLCHLYCFFIYLFTYLFIDLFKLFLFFCAETKLFLEPKTLAKQMMPFRLAHSLGALIAFIFSLL